MRRVTSPVVIGRAAERERIGALLAEVAARGPGATVLVTGEAGIGKSRLLREVAARANAGGLVVLHGSCDEFGAEASPLAALAEMLPALERALKDHAPELVESPVWEALLTLRGVVPRAGAGGAGLDVVAVTLAGQLAERVPLAVIVDDLHWADASTCRLFQRLARDAATLPVLLVGAYRDGEVAGDHPLRLTLGAVHREAAPEVLDLELPRTPERRDHALVRLEAALATCREIGARPLEEEIVALARATGLTLDAPRRPVTAEAAVPAGPSRPALTPRELEVLHRLAAGDSNGQIAIRLGISVKTASVHVTNILRKLDAANRVDAAMRASRLGLVEPMAAGAPSRRR